MEGILDLEIRPELATASPECALSLWVLRSFDGPDGKQLLKLVPVHTGRKTDHRALTTGDPIWPEYLEYALIEGLIAYHEAGLNISNGQEAVRFIGRNSYIEKFIFLVTEEARTAKQVGSRMQQIETRSDDQFLQELIGYRRARERQLIRGKIKSTYRPHKDPSSAGLSSRSKASSRSASRFVGPSRSKHFSPLSPLSELPSARAFPSTREPSPPTASGTETNSRSSPSTFGELPLFQSSVFASHPSIKSWIATCSDAISSECPPVLHNAPLDSAALEPMYQPPAPVLYGSTSLNNSVYPCASSPLGSSQNAAEVRYIPSAIELDVLFINAKMPRPPTVDLLHHCPQYITLSWPSQSSCFEQHTIALISNTPLKETSAFLIFERAGETTKLLQQESVTMFTEGCWDSSNIYRYVFALCPIFLSSMIWVQDPQQFIIHQIIYQRDAIPSNSITTTIMYNLQCVEALSSVEPVAPQLPPGHYNPLFGAHTGFGSAAAHPQATAYCSFPKPGDWLGTDTPPPPCGNTDLIFAAESASYGWDVVPPRML